MIKIPDSIGATQTILNEYTSSKEILALIEKLLSDLDNIKRKYKSFTATDISGIEGSD